MQIDVQKVADQGAEMAKLAGANHARIVVTRERYIQLVRAEQQLERIEESSSMTLRASLFVDGRYSTHTTTDLRDEALNPFFSNAVAMTRYLEADPARSLPPSALYTKAESRDLRLLDEGYDAITTEARGKICEQLEAAVPQSKVALNRVEATYYDAISERALVNTNGFSGYQQKTQYWVGISLSGDGAEGRKVRQGRWEGRRHQDALPELDEMAQWAHERLLMSMGARPMATFRGAMVVENRTARRLLSTLVQPMSGGSLQQRRSFLEGKRGQSIGSAALTMIDDPFVASGMGSTLFDGEGIPVHRRSMIAQGVLKNYYIDTYYGNKLGWQPTTGSPTNVTMVPGEKDLAALLVAAGKGIFVTGFLGGNSNATTGDFSLGINGFYIEDGQIVKPIQEMNIAGNHLKFWHKLRDVGNDPYQPSSYRLPSLLFDDILFSGV